MLRHAVVLVPLFLITMLPSLTVAQELIVKRNVNLRAGPSSGSGKIRTLEPPELLVRTATPQSGDYLEVITELEETGWVYRHNVGAAPSAAGTPAGQPTGASHDTGALVAENCPFGAPAHGDGFGETLIIARTGYALEHSGSMKTALWVCEHVTRQELSGTAVRRNKFRADPQLAGHPRAELKDYENSGYDRGHLAPAGNQVHSQQQKDETFFLSNMAPQLPSFNRQVWRQLETMTRDWARTRGELYIVTGPIVYDAAEDDPATADGYIDYYTIGEGAVTVPTHFYKIVVGTDAAGQVEAIAFMLENRGYARPYNFQETVEPIDRIEELTGLDFLPDLAHSEEATIEAATPALW